MSILTPFALLFLLWNSDPQKSIVYRGPLNEHSKRVWFQLVLWFQRRTLNTENYHFDTFWPLVSFTEFLLTWFQRRRFKTDSVHFAALGLLFLLCNSDQKIFLRGPSTEHSYQVWFKFSQWFQRMRFKTIPVSTRLGILFLLCTSFCSTRALTFWPSTEHSCQVLFQLAV